MFICIYINLYSNCILFLNGLSILQINRIAQTMSILFQSDLNWFRIDFFFFIVLSKFKNSLILANSPSLFLSFFLALSLSISTILVSKFQLFLDLFPTKNILFLHVYNRQHCSASVSLSLSLSFSLTLPFSLFLSLGI